MKTTIISIAITVLFSISFVIGQENISYGIEMDTSQAMLLGNPTDSSGSRMFWYPRKSILLVGTGNAFDRPSVWKIDSIGVYSTSFGAGNEPYGDVAMTWGVVNSINKHAIYSTAWGKRNAIVDTASYSTAWGRGNRIYKQYGTAWGTSNKVLAAHGTAFGKNNCVRGELSTVWGRSNDAFNSHSTIGGFGNITKGKYSTAFGLGLLTNSATSAVFGIFNDTTLLITNSHDTVGVNTPLFIVGNGKKYNERSNALSIFSNGFMKLGNGFALADLHIKQSADEDNVSTAGIRLENKNDTDYWQIYSSGDRLSFGRFGNQVAYIDEDGSFVDNTMLLRDEGQKMSSLKSLHFAPLELLEFKTYNDSRQNKKIKIDSNSLIKTFPQLLRFDDENKPIAIDKDQLLLFALTKLKEHEKQASEMLSLIKIQEGKINILESKLE